MVLSETTFGYNTQILTQHKYSFKDSKNRSNNDAVLRCSKKVTVTRWTNANWGFVWKVKKKKKNTYSAAVNTLYRKQKNPVFVVQYLTWHHLVAQDYAVVS